MALSKLCHKWRAATHKAVQVRIIHAAESIACLLVAYELEISCPIGASVHNNIVQYILQRTASGSGNPGLPVLRPAEEALGAEEQVLLNMDWLQEKSALLIVSRALGKLCHKWRAATQK